MGLPVTLNNICKVYPDGSGKLNLFDNFNFEFKSESVNVIMGPSGSGKTTLLNFISGIDLPTSGDVMIGDTRINGLKESERTHFRAKNIGFVFQFFHLIPGLTVMENIQMMEEIAERSHIKENLEELMELTGISHLKNRYPENLSGGEKQKTAIARALIHDPQILLADEPTGNLDRESAEIIREILKEMSIRRKTTIILVTHDTEALKFADIVCSPSDPKEVPAETDSE